MTLKVIFFIVAFIFIIVGACLISYTQHISLGRPDKLVENNKRFRISFAIYCVGMALLVVGLSLSEEK